MPCVYILQSLTTGKYDVGSTVDLERRLSEHQRHHSPYTRGRGPWQLVYHEHHADLQAARKREDEIKGWKSHARIADWIARSRALSD
jgi:putative endonuclease